MERGSKSCARNLPARRKIVLAGVAGVGMSALAQLLLERGFDVFGTDRLYDQSATTDTIARLVRRGVRMTPQDGTAIDADTEALVVSTALEDDNPDLCAARRKGVPVRHRAEVLAEMLAGMRTIAVGGTSGKSTVTAMIGWIFTQAGLGPTVVNGAPLIDWVAADAVGNLRVGKGDIAIVEADESDRSLLNFRPEVASIGNISRDHFDLDETIALFRAFAERAGGKVVLGPTVPEGIAAAEKSVRAEFDFRREDGHFGYKGGSYRCPLPGEHNLENALVAVAVCDIFGIEPAIIATALESFAGIERRLQTVGEFRGAQVIDDYAHNPAKIRAAWQTVASSSERVLAVWRPHGFGPLHAMRDELLDTFRDLCTGDDRLFLLPVYYAGGTAERKTTASDFVERLCNAGINAELCENYVFLRDKLARLAQPGDSILLMGARDPDLPRFARYLCAY